MNTAVTLVFPHQLFHKSEAFKKENPIILIEDPLFFTQYPFHKQKLLLHRLSMRHWAESKSQEGYNVIHIRNTKQSRNSMATAIEERYPHIRRWDTIEPDDYLLKKRWFQQAQERSIQIHTYPNPGFITSEKEWDMLVEPQKGYYMHRFYVNQRKHKGILLDTLGKPIGGKWSFDADNRKKVPKDAFIPGAFQCTRPLYFEEEAAEINRKWPQNPGTIAWFNHVTNRTDALSLLEHFIKTKFIYFGDYEDALDLRSHTLWHSLLSSAINIGLITPQEILEKITSYTIQHKVPLNSLEGFIRQITGWREFMRIVYNREGISIRNSNYFEHTLPMPEQFYTGTTGIIPMDQSIQTLQKHAYTHHIERLMVAGNLMLLLQIHPHNIYKWFMEWYIDAYDWVMVPNVYSMSQYADGGLLTTKPYISGSAYIHKMSNYSKGNWSGIWDSLYWTFLDQNKEQLEGNIRMKMMYALLKKMPLSKKEAHYSNAQKYKEQLWG